MLKKLALVIVVSTLAGCASLEAENFHQETLSAIHNAEVNISQRLNTLELQSNHQASYIDNLETEITSLKHQVARLNKHVYQKLKPTTPPAEETITPVKAPPSNKVLLGRVEHVMIDSIKQTFDARVDTGAATSSLNATDIEEFERNGKNWVRFHLPQQKAELSSTHWIEAPVTRYVKIRQASSSETERRAVVDLWITVGSLHERTEFTLADRSHMSHPVLLGREFIRDIALVDVSQQFIQTSTQKM